MTPGQASDGGFVAGSGPALLLLHGIGDSSDTWREVIPELAKDFTVIAPDLLGHGRSDRPRADYSIAAYACGMRGQVITMLDRCYLAEGMPTLLIWGRRDAIIPVDQARVVHEAMPGSQLEIFDDAGHFPHHQDPARFLAQIREFMNTTEPANYSRGQWRTLLCSGMGMPKTTSGPVAVPDPIEDATIGA